jgi:hypothetical protein
MKRYIIKKHCEATEALCVSQGRVQDYFYGKGGVTLGRDFLPSPSIVLAQGMVTEEEAMELLSVKQKYADLENMTGNWVVTLSVLEADIHEEF